MFFVFLLPVFQCFCHIDLANMLYMDHIGDQACRRIVAAQRIRRDLLHQGDVLNHRKSRNKVIALKHKADLRRTVIRHLVVVQRRDVAAVHDDGAFRRIVQAA